MHKTAPPQSPPETDDSDSSQLCPGCMEINDTRAHFCTGCGAPLSSYAATAPFERIMAEGHVYRSAVENPRSPVILAGIWLIFGVMALASGSLLFLGTSINFMQIALGIFMLAVSVIILWRTTAGFMLARRNQAAPEEASVEEQ